MFLFSIYFIIPIKQFERDLLNELKLSKLFWHAHIKEH